MSHAPHYSNGAPEYLQRPQKVVVRDRKVSRSKLSLVTKAYQRVLIDQLVHELSQVRAMLRTLVWIQFNPHHPEDTSSLNNLSY